MAWKASHYTHLIPLKDGNGVVYNGRSGALVKLSPGAFERCGAIMASTPQGKALSASHEGDDLFAHLIAGSFVVEENFDELAFIEDQYNRERERSQFLLTILPTFGCNLGCDYCFVGKKRGAMDRERQDQIIEFVTERFASQQFPSMAVDWFGGEPLLALGAIEYLSQAFLSLCAKYDTPYSAQIITNGTMISDKAIEVMTKSGIDRLQITLDGLQEIHDQRRPSKLRVISSFEQTILGLGKVVGKFVIRLRINVDKHNLPEAWRLLEFFESQGWLGADTSFYPYLARISPFTDACASVATEVCTIDEFQETNIQWMKRLHEYGVPVAFQGLYQFPEPKLYNCGAIGNNGFIFNPNGEIHKCGLAVDDSSEAIGTLGQELDADHQNARKWKEWSPLANPVCRGCEFLPSCLGGCPRNQMQMREVQKKENCQYYQQHENRILATHLELAQL
ncbi:MAG TPA: radical SAM protein [Pyrinomonadaceae bacterium]|jgi:uncharacterized protein|nr:radical SAM protein [Pyrinomonadaceae bacterium]